MMSSLTAITLAFTKAGVLVAAVLVVIAAIDPSIYSAAIAGCFMILNSFLIWYLTHRQSKIDRQEQERLELFSKLMDKKDA